MHVLKFELVAKFCHFAELLGAFVYPSYAGNANLNFADILENLSKYRVGDIDNFYQDFQKGTTLDNIKRNNFKHLFGYDRIKPGQSADRFIDNSLTSITEVLQTVGNFIISGKVPTNATNMVTACGLDLSMSIDSMS